MESSPHTYGCLYGKQHCSSLHGFSIVAFLLVNKLPKCEDVVVLTYNNQFLVWKLCCLLRMLSFHLLAVHLQHHHYQNEIFFKCFYFCLVC